MYLLNLNFRFKTKEFTDSSGLIKLYFDDNMKLKNYFFYLNENFKIKNRIDKDKGYWKYGLNLIRKNNKDIFDFKTEHKILNKKEVEVINKLMNNNYKDKYSTIQNFISFVLGRNAVGTSFPENKIFSLNDFINLIKNAKKSELVIENDQKYAGFSFVSLIKIFILNNKDIEKIEEHIFLASLKEIVPIKLDDLFKMCDPIYENVFKWMNDNEE